MKRWTTILGALLAVQLVAVGVSVSRHRGAEGHAPDQPLLAFDRGAIDGIVVRDGDGRSVRLTRTAAGWRLAEPIDFDADGARVGRLLTTLEGLRKGWAVATSREALERFELTDGRFQRRLQLLHGDTPVATLTVGRSAGLRRSYVRAGDEQAVYAVELPVFELGTRQTDWLDHTVLQLGEDDIEAITLPGGVTLRRVKGSSSGGEAAATGGSDTTPGDRGKASAKARFVADGAPQGAPPLDQQAAGTLVKRVAGLRIVDVLGREEKPDYGLADPVLSLTVTVGGEQGGERRYVIGKPEGKDWYALRTSARPELFKLSAFVVEGLEQAAKTDALFPAPAAKTAEEGAGAAAQGAPAVAGDGEDATPPPSG